MNYLAFDENTRRYTFQWNAYLKNIDFRFSYQWIWNSVRIKNLYNSVRDGDSPKQGGPRTDNHLSGKSRGTSIANRQKDETKRKK